MIQINNIVFSVLDSKNILSIAPLNTEHLHNLTTIQIEKLNKKPDEKSEMIFHLKKLVKSKHDDYDDTTDLYITEPFEPPNELFKILVKT